MSYRDWSFLTALGFVALLLPVSFAADEEPLQPVPPDVIEVQPRGPVHEGYAQPLETLPRPSPVVPAKPHPPIEELPPDQKPEGAQWINGYWAWDEERKDFVWVSGFWRVPPPGRRWVPGYWKDVPGGSQWTPGVWVPLEQRELEVLPPPPPLPEVGPSVPPPSEDHVYSPGCWIYREERYLWQPGYWTDCPPGWVWIPNHYSWSPSGCVFVSGYWDFPPPQRGVLFAPVCFRSGYLFRPGCCYTPNYVVHQDCLFGSLFVRPSCGHYFFGDYFAAGYRGLGFTAWVDYQSGGCRDPLFNYYRGHHRGNPGWERNLRALYAGRHRGDMAPPPRTLAQQNALLRNARNGDVQHVRMVSPLAQADRTPGRPQAVVQQQRTRELQAVRDQRQLASLRQAAEARPGPAARAGGVAPRARVALPSAMRAQADDRRAALPPAPRPAQIGAAAARNADRPAVRAQDNGGPSAPRRPEAQSAAPARVRAADPAPPRGGPANNPPSATPRVAEVPAVRRGTAPVAPRVNVAAPTVRRPAPAAVPARPSAVPRAPAPVIRTAPQNIVRPAPSVINRPGAASAFRPAPAIRPAPNAARPGPQNRPRR